MAVVVARRGDRTMLQAEQQVVAHRQREQIGFLADVGRPRAQHVFGELEEILVVDLDRAAGRQHEPRQHLAQHVLARPRAADHRHLRVGRQRQRDAVEQLHPPVLGHRHAGQHHLVAERRRRTVGDDLQLGRHHALGLELVDHLLVLDLHVLALLVPVDQLLDRRGQVLVGEQHAHHRADIHLAGDREIAAHQVDRERRHLRQDVVPELGDELLVVELEADPEDVAEPLGDVGALVVGRAVDMDLVHAVGGLGDAAGQQAGRQLALAAEHQHRPAQPRDDRHLHRQQHDHDDRQQPVLHHDEDDRRQRLAAEEHRLHEGVADEAAERLDLVLDHGRELGLLDLAEVGRREAQDAVVELVAQAAQHALAHAALLGVDALLELAVDHHGGQEDEAHGHEIGQLIDREAVEQMDVKAAEEVRQAEIDRAPLDDRRVLEGVARDAVVDDRLRHAERQEVEDLRKDDEDQNDDLLGSAVAPDVGKQISLHETRVSLRPSPTYIRSGP